MEVSGVEKDLFSVKEKMEPIFNFIDLSFQLLDSPPDDNVALLLRKLTELRQYFDRRSTLNVHHSEIIIGLCRFCARRDKVLSQALDGDFTRFVFASETKQTPEMDTTVNTEPQPKSMKVESQSKLEWLCNIKVLVSDFEATLDSLVGDSQGIISDFQ